MKLHHNFLFLLLLTPLFISCDDSDEIPAPPVTPPPPVELPGNWELKQQMPVATKEISNSSVLAGDEIWIMGGVVNNSITTAVHIYNITDNTWSAGPDLPVAVWRSNAAFADGQIFIFGGYTSLAGFPFSPINEVYAINLASTTPWTARANMPTARGSAVSVTVDNNGTSEIHVIGGASNSALANHEVYIPSTDTWNSATPLPAIRSGLTGVAINNSIYIMGGYLITGGSVQSQSNLYRFDLSSQAWLELASSPEGRLGIDAATLDGDILVFGGGVQSSLSNALRYDVDNNSWTFIKDMPTPVSFMSVESYQEKIYAIGGGPVNLNRTDAVTANRALSFDP